MDCFLLQDTMVQAKATRHRASCDVTSGMEGMESWESWKRPSDKC
ncbi:hypothetical protein GDO86_013823 [Hymenochirus boettgeri]|uniref:Uncharacterized protein n=1 Tax=Hymenochirus boettgeri TaxID=247094 RepID=A0A8T2JLF0_9PIPI|nr:hypothetical protein GDO86_013821 [Hymenochirus boettgeri]KAG8446098.1 hypothetical protein GDO86_013823 [Hymenochirus boettgeri]